jgi:hypothetical protein
MAITFMVIATVEAPRPKVSKSRSGKQIRIYLSLRAINCKKACKECAQVVHSTVQGSFEVLQSCCLI